jgi:hypothetical protein
MDRGNSALICGAARASYIRSETAMIAGSALRDRSVCGRTEEVRIHFPPQVASRSLANTRPLPVGNPGLAAGVRCQVRGAFGRDAQDLGRNARTLAQSLSARFPIPQRRGMWSSRNHSFTGTAISGPRLRRPCRGAVR